MTFRSPEMNSPYSHPDRYLLLSFPYVPFCSVFVFAAPFTYFLWHDFCPVLLLHLRWAELWMQQSAPAEQRRKIEEAVNFLPSLPAALFSAFCATQLSVYPKTVPCSSHSSLSVCTQKFMGFSTYLENSCYYRVPYQTACKCVQFVVQKMNEFILIIINC